MAVRQIERAVILEPEDIEAMHRPFVNKGNSDPVVRAFREALRASTPGWLAALDTESKTVSRSRLDELLTAIGHRRDLVGALPDGEVKTEALGQLTSLDELITEMLAQLDGTTSGAGSL
jgi:hypothetical protein